MVRGQQFRGGRVPDEGAPSWVHAAALGLLLVGISIVVFILVPDRLLSYLSLHVAPRVRDAIVGAWWVASFALLTWAFVRVQRMGRP